MKVYKLRCDRCGTEIACDDPVRGTWYTVDRNNPREWADAGDSDRFDFCSLPCLSVWARSRELVRTAS